MSEATIEFSVTIPDARFRSATAEEREQYAQAVEDQQRELGGRLLQKLAELVESPDPSRNIMSEVAEEVPCRRRDAQMAFIALQGRGEMMFTREGVFVPTDRGYQTLEQIQAGTDQP